MISTHFIFKDNKKECQLSDFYSAIYVRNGQLLWESTRLDEDIPVDFWDGTFKGREISTEACVWKIHKARF